MKRILSAIALVFSAMLLLSPSVFAATGEGHFSALAYGAALAIGLGAFGGALGQGKAVSAALEGIGRNPGAADKMFVPMIVGLALIESLVIYALLIAFMLQGKIA
ncbi:MAG: F-type H+-transporting ATPase subunit c [bacterium]|jgi:F-type H+-transporting ATPase subunit c